MWRFQVVFLLQKYKTSIFTILLVFKTLLFDSETDRQRCAKTTLKGIRVYSTQNTLKKLCIKYSVY